MLFLPTQASSIAWELDVNSEQLKQHIIIPTLKRLDLYSEDAVQLLLGTAAQESKMGEYITQLDDGPARGIYQMEVRTHDDIWEHYLKYKRDLRDHVFSLLVPGIPKEEQLVWNLAYATAMARVHYLRVKEPLPNKNNIQAMASYYKKYYNTELGRATITEFVLNYHKYVDQSTN